MAELVKVAEQDYLEQDEPIRGQNYACVSFVSPEDVIKSKEAYFIAAYLKTFLNKNTELLNGLKTLFPDKENEIVSIQEQYSSLFSAENIYDDYVLFKTENDQDISDKYSKENKFQTNIRGFKIRGSYDSLEEAKMRAEKLKRLDNKHNIYISQVGCWCPWAANPNDIESSEYSEDQLNTMMKEYIKNKEGKESFYTERKQELIERTKLAEEDKKKNATIMEEEDTWMERKTEVKIEELTS
jgi:hypothetical protein